MKRNDIDKIFTEKVAIYLSMGATISTKTMNGHQGEEGKVDLILGGQLIRIWLEQKTMYNWMDETDKFSGTMMILRVGIWNKPASEAGEWSTVWMKDLDTIDEVIFYQVGRRGHYVDSLEVALEAQQKNRNRSRARHKFAGRTVVDVSDAARAAAYRYLKRKHGYKRVSWNDIEVNKTVKYGEATQFIINYHGNKYHLH